MENQNYAHRHVDHGLQGFVLGTLLGGLAGAVTMLLLAPQSGRRTRAKLQRAGIDLREQTGRGLEEAVEQTTNKAEQLTTTVREQAEKIQLRGQALIAAQQERWTPVVKAVQGNGA